MDVHVSIPAKKYNEIEGCFGSGHLDSIANGVYYCSSDGYGGSSSVIGFTGNSDGPQRFQGSDKTVFKKLRLYFDSFFEDYKRINPASLQTFYRAFKVNVVTELEDACGHDVFITRFGIKQYDGAYAVYPSSIDDPVFWTDNWAEMTDKDSFPLYDAKIDLTFYKASEDFNVLRGLKAYCRRTMGSGFTKKRFNRFLEECLCSEEELDDSVFDLKYTKAYGWMFENLEERASM